MHDILATGDGSFERGGTSNEGSSFLEDVKTNEDSREVKIEWPPACVQTPWVEPQEAEDGEDNSCKDDAFGDTYTHDLSKKAAMAFLESEKRIKTASTHPGSQYMSDLQKTLARERRLQRLHDPLDHAGQKLRRSHSSSTTTSFNTISNHVQTQTSCLGFSPVPSGARNVGSPAARPSKYEFVDGGKGDSPAASPAASPGSIQDIDTSRSSMVVRARSKGGGNLGKLDNLEVPAIKRPYDTAFQVNLKPENEEEGSSSSRSRIDDDRKPSLLACPFYRRDGHKYHTCLSYQLRRPKDVKQHLYRRHCQPELYCSRCFRVFQKATERDEHTRLASCKVEPDPHYDGISAAQKKSLAHYSRKLKSPEEQWYEIWDIIFPDEERPASVYAGQYLSEMTALLRNSWQKQQSEIVSNVLSAGNYEKRLKPVVMEIMENVFKRFEEKMSLLTVDEPADTALTPRRVDSTMTDGASCDSTVHDNDYGGSEFQIASEHSGTMLSQTLTPRNSGLDDTFGRFDKPMEVFWASPLSSQVLAENLEIDWSEVQEYTDDNFVEQVLRLN